MDIKKNKSLKILKYVAIGILISCILIGISACVAKIKHNHNSDSSKNTNIIKNIKHRNIKNNMMEHQRGFHKPDSTTNQ